MQDILSNICILDVIKDVANARIVSTKGNWHSFLCPLHNEKTPSFYANSRDQYFNCFGCSKKGNAINFIMYYNSISFSEACKFLEDKYGLKKDNSKLLKQNYEDLKSQRKQNYIKTLLSYFTYCANTMKFNIRANDYLKTRGLNLSDNIIIGFDDGSYINSDQNTRSIDYLKSIGLVNSINQSFFKNRIIFCIKNNEGDILGFTGRDISNQNSIKWLHSKNNEFFQKSNHLFNYSDTFDKFNSIYICEGPFDVLILDNIGLPGVCSMGSNISKHQIESIDKINKPIILMDSDSSGVDATCPLYISTATT